MKFNQNILMWVLKLTEIILQIQLTHQFNIKLKFKKKTKQLLDNNFLLTSRSSALMVTGKYVDFFSQFGNSVENVEKISRPRYIKSHLPWELLPQQLKSKKPKVHD